MPSLVDKYFSQIDFDAIEAAVKKAEQSTSGEIAVELASHSRNWLSERILYALAFALICILGALYFTRDVNWGVYYDTTQAIFWGAVGFVVTYFAWGWFLKRSSRRRSVVWKRALRSFGQMAPVRGLAGVLIFVSLEEDQAAVVADKGIASKVPPDYWDAPQATIVNAMKQGHHAEGIIQVIETIANELARHFPRESGDINELPDRPRKID